MAGQAPDEFSGADGPAVALTPLSRQIDIDRSGGGLPPWIRKIIENSKLTLNPAGQGISALRLRFSKPLWTLFGMVAAGLALVCANIMNLQFARMSERRRELSVRLAIGAGRLRIVQQLFVEALVIAMTGGMIGLAISRPIAAAISSLISQGGIPVTLDLRVDSGLLALVFGLSVMAALACGVAPGVRATREGLALALQQSSSRSTASKPLGRALGTAIPSFQFALSLVLVAASFLFAFSLYKLTRFDTGVRRDRLAMMDVDAKEAGYQGADLARLHRRILERLRGTPGVGGAAIVLAATALCAAILPAWRAASTDPMTALRNE